MIDWFNNVEVGHISHNSNNVLLEVEVELSLALGCPSRTGSNRSIR